MLKNPRRAARRFQLLESLESRVLLSAAPTGYIDIANRSVIAGWAFDADEGALPMDVELTINGTLYTATANQYRPDLIAPFGSAYHGWSFTPPSSLPPGTSVASVDVVNKSTGERTHLGDRNLVNPAPQALVEVHNASTLSGYIFDSDLPAGGSRIRIDVDGVQGTPVVANSSRPDLAPTFGTANVGFSVNGSFAGKVIEVYSLDDPSGSATLLWTNNQLPNGNLDVINPNYLIGWAFDPDAPEKAVNMRPDVDGVAGTPFAANTIRSDLQTALGSTAHGWSVGLSSLTPGTHSLKIYMLDPEATSAAPVLLGTTTVTNNAPVGYVDTITSTQLQGWAADPDLGTAPTTVRVYVDDFLFTTVAASNNRADLTAVIGSPNHGFSIDLSSLAAGSHAVTVTAEDDRASSKDETVIFDGFINNTSPRGFVDLVTSTTIAGWAQDPDTPTTPIDVDVYLDGAYVGTTTADGVRSDLTAAIGSANHAFSVDIPSLSFGTHVISVYAAESQGTISTLIGSRTITNNRPTGVVDSFSAQSISGWAADYDATTLSLDVLVYINGTPALTGTANTTRNDLIPYFGSANHGFAIAMPTLSAGTYQIDVYVLDKNNGLRTAIGSQSITI